MSRLAYEQAVLAEIASEQALALEDFVSLPAYIGKAPSYDAWYDGHIVRIEIQQPTLANAGSAVVDLLGPYWDRIFRCRFHEASKIEAIGVNMMEIPNIHTVSLEETEDERICTFQTFQKGQELRLTFKTGDVTRLMLRTPLERMQIGS
jgi:hypothetical protein